MECTISAYSAKHILRTSRFLHVLLTGLLPVCFLFVGCSGHVELPSIDQWQQFENAGPDQPSLDTDRLFRAKMRRGPYRVVPGDVLELTMPAILQVMTAEQPQPPGGVTPYLCRVSESGTVNLPAVGEVEVVGKSLAEIESAIIQAYHPKYTATRPSVVARVAEYRTAKVSITGAVQHPGVYELRSDQMSLVALLMEAGGIVDEGAAAIRIIRAEAEVYPAPYVVPDEIEVQLAFQQLAPSTLGWLTVRRGGAILLTDKLDITSEIQRQAMLQKLAQREPRVSTAKVEQRLCSLVDTLGLSPPSAGGHSAVGENTSSDSNLTTTIPTHDSTSGDTLYEQLEPAYGGYRELTETLGVESPPGITKAATAGRAEKAEQIILPVRGLNIPFADVALQDGETVVVERLEQRIFTVVGLVDRPGNFPYPTDSKYNLMQALACAGGLDKIAEPRYATIYRLKADGTIVDRTLQIVEGSKLTDALNTTIKPGDIVDVAHTCRTRTNVFLERLFHIQIGAYLPLLR
jgi:protein involved in polysaccharide export with SLBB domain